MADFSITGEVKLNSDPAEKSTSKWTVAAGNMIADFAKKAASSLASVVRSGIDYNATMEKYLTNFTVMLGDEEAAAEKLEQIRKMAASTPFTMPELTDATQTLLQFGITADDTTDVLQRLGDISLGNSDKLQTLTRAYGKMSSAQKVTLENVNMMIDAGFNPLNQICDATGETMSDLYKRISDGKVSFNELEAAVVSATSEGGQFFNGMAEASQTYSGRLATMQENVTALVGELTDGLFGALGGLIDIVNDVAVSFLDSDEKMDSLKNTVTLLTGAIAAGAAAFAVYRARLELHTLLTAVKKAMNGMTVAQYAATTAQKLLNAALNANPIGIVVTAVAALTAALVTAYQTSETFRSKVNGAFEWVKSTADTALGAVVDWLNEMLAKLKGAVAYISNLKNGFGDARDAFDKAYNDAIREYTAEKQEKERQRRKALHEERVRQAQEEAAAAKAAAQTVEDSVEETVETVEGAGKTIGSSVESETAKVVETVTDGTETVAQTIKESAASSLSGLWKEVQTRAEDGALGTAVSLAEAVKKGDWKSIGAAAASAIYDGLSADQQQQIESFALGIVDQLNGVLGDAQEKLADAAWKIGEQIYTGITDKLPDILDKAQTLGSGLKTAFETLKGPLSTAAKAISEGLSGGLLSAFPSIYAAMGGLISSIGAAFEAMLTAISAALDATGIGLPAGLVVAGAAVALGAAIAAIVSKLGGSHSGSTGTAGNSGGGSGSTGSGSMDGDITIDAGTGDLEDAIRDNTEALAKTNAALADMVRQANNLVLSDNMRLGSTVAASGTAQIRSAANQYREGDTNITQNFYGSNKTAAEQQREARWEADRAKAQKR